MISLQSSGCEPVRPWIDSVQTSSQPQRVISGRNKMCSYPDSTFAVHWALKANYLFIYLYSYHKYKFRFTKLNTHSTAPALAHAWSRHWRQKLKRWLLSSAGQQDRWHFAWWWLALCFKTLSAYQFQSPAWPKSVQVHSYRGVSAKLKKKVKLQVVFSAARAY